MKKAGLYIILNNRIIKPGEFIVSPFNRALQYGDGVFETIHYHKGQPLFLKDHLDRLKQGIAALNMDVPDEITIPILNTNIEKLITLNKIKKDARIRLQVYRKEGGFYIPGSNTADYLLRAEPLSRTGFILNKDGLRIEICENERIKLLPFQNFKTCNSIPYVMAGLYARKNKLDDCLLLNTKNKIAEAISSNVFIVKSGKIFTPPLKDGCIAGVMRKYILKSAKYLHISVKEKSLSPSDLKVADEIFLTNVIQGIRWVETFKKKKKKNKFTLHLMKELLRAGLLFK